MMKLALPLLLGLGLVLSSIALTRADDSKSVCMKDGSEVSVSGDDAAAQKADCEKNGGTWQAAKPAKKAAKSDSDDDGSKGGGW